jgi:hypothetical protein
VKILSALFMVTLLLSFQFIVSPQVAQAADYMDTDNESPQSGIRIHGCGGGFLRGHDLAKDDLLCSNGLSPAYIDDSGSPRVLGGYRDGYDEPRTMINGVHACQWPYFMMGVDAKRDVLLCQRPVAVLNDGSVLGRIITLTCPGCTPWSARYEVRSAGEYIVYPPPVWFISWGNTVKQEAIKPTGMNVCPATYFMIGIDVVKNHLLCVQPYPIIP